MKIILNAGSGNHDVEVMRARLESLFPGGNSEILLVRDGGELAAATARAAAGEDPVVVAAGGDGTVSQVAAALVGTDKTLGVMPCGTLNHFAKDLRIPMDLEQAAGIILAGNSKLVDVGEVNGHIFVNNSSVGFYPSVVRDREQQQRRLKRGKWSAMVHALFAVARRFPIRELSLSAAGKQIHRATPFLFVGNNRYEFETSRMGTRRSLSCGELSLFVAHPKSPLRLFFLAIRALFGRLHANRDFDLFCAPEALIRSTRHHLSVAADGEVMRMDTPLNYRIRPAALRVLAPPDAELNTA